MKCQLFFTPIDCALDTKNQTNGPIHARPKNPKDSPIGAMSLARKYMMDFPTRRPTASRIKPNQT